MRTPGLSISCYLRQYVITVISIPAQGLIGALKRSFLPDIEVVGVIPVNVVEGVAEAEDVVVNLGEGDSAQVSVVVAARASLAHAPEEQNADKAKFWSRHPGLFFFLTTFLVLVSINLSNWNLVTKFMINFLAGNPLITPIYRPRIGELSKYHPKATRTLFVGNISREVCDLLSRV